MITSTDGAVTIRPPPGPRRILATFWSSTRRTASRNTARLVPYRWTARTPTRARSPPASRPRRCPRQIRRPPWRPTCCHRAAPGHQVGRRHRRDPPAGLKVSSPYVATKCRSRACGGGGDGRGHLSSAGTTPTLRAHVAGTYVSHRPVDHRQRRKRCRRSSPTLFELVGCYAWSPDKVGTDVGELCGIDPLGVAATDDVDALLALRARLRRLQPDVARHRRARAHPVGRRERRGARRRSSPATTSAPDRDRIVEACEQGGSTMFGSGISPGFAELLAIVSATICDRVDKVTINEAADTTFYDSPATERSGRLRRADRPPRPARR